MRSTWNLRIAAMATAAALAFTASAAIPPELDARFEAVMRENGVPGMAVAIVEQGKVTHAKGYGVRRLGSPERVDADTLFPLGSASKAMTSAAIAILVDEGKLGWDDNVIDHLPGFQMYDPWVTREISVRDLLVHRSGLGLGAGDLLFVPRSSLSRAETVRRLRYLKPATSFRSGYAYDNLLYVVAGQLIEAVSGQSWETLVRERVLKTAGMRVSTTDDASRFATTNRVQPHARLDGGLRGIGRQEVLDEQRGFGANAAPAGGVSSSANDMSRWLAIQLAHGALPGTKGRLFSDSASREMWTPQVLLPITPYPVPLTDATPQFSTYALGWRVRDYRGVKIIEHGGAAFGVQTRVVLVPGRQVGFSLQINSEDDHVLLGLMYELLDHYFGVPSRDWVTAFAAYKQARVAKAQDAMQTATAAATPSSPALPLKDYAGGYADPWYGPIDISHVNNGLRINFKQTPDMVGSLKHWQYDTFQVQWDDRGIEPAYVSFALDAQGKVDRITMKAVSPLADFSYDYHDLLFTPQRRD